MNGYDWDATLRDRQLSDAPFAGFISDIGIYLMAAGGLLGVLAAFREKEMPLAALAAFCLVFAADDRLMLHERLDAIEFIIYPLYATGLALVWRAYSVSYGKLVIWPIAIAFVGFGLSGVVDVVWDPLVVLPGFELLYRYRGIGYALEDLPKFAGLGVLSIFAINEAVRVFRSQRSTGVLENKYTR